MNDSVIEGPINSFRGVGSSVLPTPINVVLFSRSSRKRFQQEVLLNKSHQRFVLIFNLKSPDSVSVGNRKLALTSGQALLVYPCQFLQYKQFETDLSSWIICAFELDDISFFESLRNRVLEVNEKTMAARGALMAEWAQSEPQAELLQAALLRTLVLLKSESRAAEIPCDEGAGAGLVGRVSNFLSEWRGGAVFITDLAEDFGLSESRLRALFRSATGMSLGSYMLSYRIKRATELLRTSDLPIAEVAEESGFGSPQAFSRVFKKETGCTPRAYRAQL